MCIALIIAAVKACTGGGGGKQGGGGNGATPNGQYAHGPPRPTAGQRMRERREQRYAARYGPPGGYAQAGYVNQQPMPQQAAPIYQKPVQYPYAAENAYRDPNMA